MRQSKHARRAIPLKRSVNKRRTARRVNRIRRPGWREANSIPSGHSSALSAVPYVSVIIPVMNERRTIAKVIREARKVHPSTEVIVVSNGTTDQSDRIAERAGAQVLRYEEPLGHDVGRTAGALAARGEVLLFIDGDMVIQATQLRPFVSCIAKGSDVALNHYSGPRNKQRVHRVVLAKHVLNELMSRPELLGMSMTAVPHALSRKALETIGAEHLSIPPLAHAIAIQKQLKLAPAHSVNVGRMNKRRMKLGSADPLVNLIDNDHLQALRWVIDQAGPRGGQSDLDRQRHLVR